MKKKKVSLRPQLVNYFGSIAAATTIERAEEEVTIGGLTLPIRDNNDEEDAAIVAAPLHRKAKEQPADVAPAPTA